MSGITTFELIVAFSVFMLAITAMMAFMFWMLNKRKESRYNEERNRIELSMMRHNLESQIYSLNEKSSNSANTWREANHLQFDGNNTKANNAEISLNEFLKAGGIEGSDIQEGNYVFVLTPFHSNYDDVFESIKYVCDKADIRCIRGDEQNFKGDIFTHVLKNIIQARIIIANLSGRNPNVMYELGIAHALDKTTIMISKLLDDLPVDIKSKRIVTYEKASDLEKSLTYELLKVMKGPNK